MFLCYVPMFMFLYDVSLRQTFESEILLENSKIYMRNTKKKKKAYVNGQHPYF